MSNQAADLSRRVQVHALHGQFYRESLWFAYQLEFESLTLEQVLEDYVALAGCRGPSCQGFTIVVRLLLVVWIVYRAAMPILIERMSA